jgi:hypothetical protein
VSEEEENNASQPPKKAQKVGAVTRIHSVRDWLKMHSLYVLGAIAFLPDLLTWLASNGYFDPANTSIAFKVAAAIGFAARVYKSKTA